MQSVFCYCSYCENKIGKFINLWTQIGEFVSPNIKHDDNLEIIGQEDIDPGVPGTQWKQQDIFCAQCSTFLGAEYLKTPAYHVLHEGRVEFLLSSVILYDDEVYPVDFVIERILNSRGNAPSNVSTATAAETQSENGTPRCFEIIDISPSKNELAGQAGNEQELADLRTQVSELQNQVNILTSKASKSVSATDHANEVATLRAENADLRRLLSNTHSNNNSERSIPSTELDILTSNVAKIGNRASQVESPQMEFEIFKGRVERLEDDRQSDEIFMSPNCRKRTSAEAGLPETNLAAKLPLVSARPSLSAHIHQLSTRRQSASLEAAGPEGTLPENGQSHQPSLPRGSSKKREPGRGERN